MEALGISGFSLNAIEKHVREKVLMYLTMRQDDVECPEDNPGITKVYDNGKCVGTFTFLDVDVGITAFHVVYCEASKEIRQDTLRLSGDGIVVAGDGQEAKLHHLVSFPHQDIAAFKVINATTRNFFDVTPCNLRFGQNIALVSFPALQPNECNLSRPLYTFGRICQNISSPYNNFLLGNYESFPQCSGGGIISADGKLVGMHVSSVYYCDEDYELDNSPDYPATCGPVHTLHWVPPPANVWHFDTEDSIDLEAPSDGEDEDASDDEDIALGMAKCALNHKGHLSVFLPVEVIRCLLLQGVLKSPPPVKKKKVKSHCEHSKARRGGKGKAF